MKDFTRIKTEGFFKRVRKDTRDRRGIYSATVLQEREDICFKQRNVEFGRERFKGFKKLVGPEKGKINSAGDMGAELEFRVGKKTEISNNG